MTYSKFYSKNLQQLNPKFDDKRTWVARLLTAFVMEDALIVSIDESSVRHDMNPSYKWRYVGCLGQCWRNFTRY